MRKLTHPTNAPLLVLSCLLTFFTACKQEENTMHCEQPVITAFQRGEVIIRTKKDDGTWQTKEYKEDQIITPEGCKNWNFTRFGREYGNKDIGHVWPQKPKNEQGTGVLPYAIQRLLENAPKKDSNIVVIVSTGVDEQLGISQEAEDHLYRLRKEGKIKEYYILNSNLVPDRHNKCVRDDKQVYTLLHLTC